MQTKTERPWQSKTHANRCQVGGSVLCDTAVRGARGSGGGVQRSGVSLVSRYRNFCRYLGYCASLRPANASYLDRPRVDRNVLLAAVLLGLYLVSTCGRSRTGPAGASYDNRSSRQLVDSR